ncbi:MAG: glycosyltransferase [Deltaproteobacteria bacterium]|jgi:glycosyltransferase involved in cell wall biosynthesis|nr:glycosyltransferase [Deltaproteobacteria bacterium]
MNTDKKALRIIEVVNVRWVNATAWYALFLSRLLKDAGHQVLVLGLKDTKSFALAEEWGLSPLALPLNSVNPLVLLSLYGKLKKLVLEFKPQVVNCHRGESFALWWLLKKFAVKAAVPFSLIRTRGDQRAIKDNLFNRILYARVSDALIATNTGIAQDMLRIPGVSPSKVHTIFGGVDEQLFYRDEAAGLKVRQAFGFGPQDFVVGLLGRLDTVKGHAVLIKALGIVKAKFTQEAKPFNLKFLCIGADSELTRVQIEDMLGREGLADGKTAFITGRVENVRAYINALNLGVLSSIGSEAIARAALEIMACGVPLISSDVGVMPDLLPADCLTPAGDAFVLSEALEKYSQTPEVLGRLGVVSTEAMVGLKADDFLRKTLAVYENSLYTCCHTMHKEI